MPDSWVDVAARVALTDANAAADFNAHSANLRLIKGGTAGTAPYIPLDELHYGNVRGSESGTIADSTIAEYRTQTYTLSGTANRKLPTTGIKKGQIIHWIVPGTYAFTAKSSDGDTVQTIMNAYIKVQALQDTPTDKTHWQIIECESLTPLKTYRLGTTYANGTPVLTTSPTGTSIISSSLIPYQCPITGAYRIKINIYISFDATSTVELSISDVIVPGPCSVLSQNNLNIITNFAYADNNPGRLHFYVSTASNVTQQWFYCDEELSSKPAWMD